MIVEPSRERCIDLDRYPPYARPDYPYSFWDEEDEDDEDDEGEDDPDDEDYRDFD